MISKAKEKGVKKMINVKTLATVERKRESNTLVNRSGVLFVMNIKKDSGIMPI